MGSYLFKFASYNPFSRNAEIELISSFVKFNGTKSSANCDIGTSEFSDNPRFLWTTTSFTHLKVAPCPKNGESVRLYNCSTLNF